MADGVAGGAVQCNASCAGMHGGRAGRKRDRGELQRRNMIAAGRVLCGVCHACHAPPGACLASNACHARTHAMHAMRATRALRAMHSVRAMHAHTPCMPGARRMPCMQCVQCSPCTHTRHACGDVWCCAHAMAGGSDARLVDMCMYERRVRNTAPPWHAWRVCMHVYARAHTSCGPLFRCCLLPKDTCMRRPMLRICKRRNTHKFERLR
eukprot:365932-Chlamydomonas_euryale.AAC.9